MASARGLSETTKDKAVYIKAPFLDEKYQQHRITATAFSSAKLPQVRKEALVAPMNIQANKRDALAGDSKPYFTCNMSFPAALVHTNAGGGGLGALGGFTHHNTQQHPWEDDDEGASMSSHTKETENDDVISRAHNLSALSRAPVSCQPNPYWQQPAPTFQPIPDRIQPRSGLQPDEMHPLLATNTAARTANAQAQQLHNESTGTTLPTPALAASVTVGRPSTAGTHVSALPQAEPYAPSNTMTAALLLSKALHAPLASHSIPANAARAANQLRTATTEGVEFRAASRIVKDIHSNNNFHNKTYHDMHNIIIPPPPAFRNLSGDAKHILQQRGPKARAKLEQHLKASNLVVQPPPRPAAPPEEIVEEEEEEEDEDGSSRGDRDDLSEASAPVKKSKKAAQKQEAPPVPVPPPAPTPPQPQTAGERKNAPSVRYNAATGDWEMIVTEVEESVVEPDQVEEEDSGDEDPRDYSLEELLGAESAISIWNACVLRKREQENPDVDPAHGPTPVDEVAGKFRVKVITPQLISLYNVETRRPGVQQYLCGRGIRMGSTITKTQAPSCSSFTTDLPAHLKELVGNTGPSGLGLGMSTLGTSMLGGGGSALQATPAAAFACSDDPNSFVLKDYNFSLLLTDKGEEVEEIQLEGMKWLSEDAFLTIADFCPNLRLLNLSGCAQLTTRALCAIATACPLIAYLNISNCNVSQEAIAVVLGQCTQLEVFCAHGVCKGANGGSSNGTDFGTTLMSPKMLKNDGSMSPMGNTLGVSNAINLESSSVLGSSTMFGATVGANGMSGVFGQTFSMSPRANTMAPGTTTNYAQQYDLGNAIHTCPMQMLYRCRNMRVLDLSFSPLLTDAAMVAIAMNCSALEILNISGCSNFGDMGMVAVGGKCSGLKCISMQLCNQPQLTTKGLQAIANAPRNLQRLDMTGVTQLDDATLKILLHQMPCLKRLSLNGCYNISDDSLRELNTSCKHLRALDVAACNKISLQTLLDLIHDVRSLLTLVVSDSCMSNAEVVMLREVRSNVRIIKNYYKPPPRINVVGYKAIEEKRKKKPKPKGKGAKGR